MENEKSLELIPADTSKKLEKHSKPIPITNIQEIMENMTTSLKIEEITKNSKNILKNLLAPPTWHVGSQFSNQGLNPCLLHCKANS